MGGGCDKWKKVVKKFGKVSVDKCMGVMKMVLK